MKRALIVVAAAASLGFSIPGTVAAQSQPSLKASAAQPAPDVKTFDQRLSEAQAQMKRMQDLRERIQQTQDPQERQRLQQEHWSAMQAAMTAMHGMGGPGMMGGYGPGPMHGVGMGGPGMMGWGGARGAYSQLTPEQMKQRQYMTDQMLGFQQQMMEHMLQRQQWLQQQPQPAQK
jgi:hypothetical protein